MNETRKWMLHRVSAIIVAPLFAWFYFSLISLSKKNYHEAIYFFENPVQPKEFSSIFVSGLEPSISHISSHPIISRIS